ncbi:MAG: penicillin-binding protein 2 [Xanthomonadales bacterium]|nr:penicillin-binding protein 2 [Gammaproteobacteria bacterium]MBT8054203.1 penicillin-binding protein 2 [Gammaproteobacteria bacterium]NND57604.1 penicillin-binding protein 2 [Xanthomonadales bacterium]NNK51328.1 penicillin-binding protein 2 [Xanthomonadales bacterium]
MRRLTGYGPGQPLKDQALEGRQFSIRALTAFLIILAAIFLLSLRYVYLQLISYEEFTARSINNQVRIVPVPPNRGLIYDRRGRPVAENRPAYRLELVPEKTADLKATIEALGRIVELPEDAFERFAENRKRYRVFDSVPLKFNLTEREMARFAVDRHRFDSVEIVPYLARYYPYGDLLTHVLGYVGRLDVNDLNRVDEGNYRGTTHIGKAGIERFYEDGLHGLSGIERIETNVQGRVLTVLDRENPVPGNDLILALDVQVQQAAWDALGDRPGAVVAIDPNDGSVLAMVSKPAFDPNLFVHGISSEDYRNILNAPGRPLFNRPLLGGYEPGSTLKPFIGLAGLELGAVTADDRVFSSGQFFLPGTSRPYRDWKRGGHGWVNMLGALEQSVNTYFYQLALDLGIDRMHDYLAQFGFGSVTGMDLLGENAGVLPSREWKRGHLSQPWYPGETVIAGIGQGFNVVTPIQLANAVATLANGGTRFEPRLLYAAKHAGDRQADKIQAPVGSLLPVRDPANWDLVHAGMRLVVHGEKGTARTIRPESGFEVAGKSGTAQVAAQALDEDMDETTATHLRHHALFIAYAPYDKPSIAVAAVVEHGGGGSREAAPVARAVIDAWLSQELFR